MTKVVGVQTDSTLSDLLYHDYSLYHTDFNIYIYVFNNFEKYRTLLLQRL